VGRWVPLRVCRRRTARTSSILTAYLSETRGGETRDNVSGKRMWHSRPRLWSLSGQTPKVSHPRRHSHRHPPECGEDDLSLALPRVPRGPIQLRIMNYELRIGGGPIADFGVRISDWEGWGSESGEKEADLNAKTQRRNGTETQGVRGISAKAGLLSAFFALFAVKHLDLTSRGRPTLSGPPLRPSRHRVFALRPSLTSSRRRGTVKGEGRSSKGEGGGVPLFQREAAMTQRRKEQRGQAQGAAVLCVLCAHCG